MSPHLRLLSSAIFAASCVLVGCEPKRAEERAARVYESCSTYEDGRPCAGEAVCSAFEPGGGDEQCTFDCVEDEECPASPVGRAACMRFLTGAHCAIRCRDDGDCFGGNQCVTRPQVDGSEVGLCLAF